MFYQYNYAACFDHNFGHHQALNEHISSNQTHWIQYILACKNGTSVQSELLKLR
jgi:hypothetical protein